MSNRGLLLIIAGGCYYYYRTKMIGAANSTTGGDPKDPTTPTDPRVPPVIVPPPVVVPPVSPPTPLPSLKLIPDDVYVFGRRTRAGVTPSVGEHVVIGGPLVGSSLINVRLNDGSVPTATMVTVLFENPGTFVYYQQRPDGSFSSDGIVSTIDGITKEGWDLTNPISLGSTRSSEFNDATGWFLDTSDNVRPTDVLIGKSLNIYGRATFGADSDSISRWLVSTGQYLPGYQTMFQKLPFACVQAPTRRQFLLIKVPLGRTLVWNG